MAQQRVQEETPWKTQLHASHRECECCPPQPEPPVGCSFWKLPVASVILPSLNLLLIYSKDFMLFEKFYFKEDALQEISDRLGHGVLNRAKDIFA